MTNKELIEMVFDLNEKIPEEFFLERSDCQFEFHSNGCSNIITFGNIYIWGDDDDPREYDDEKDDYNISIKNYVIKEFNRIILSLSNIKFIKQ